MGCLSIDPSGPLFLFLFLCIYPSPGEAAGQNRERSATINWLYKVLNRVAAQEN
jgi:hypothetical protein